MGSNRVTGMTIRNCSRLNYLIRLIDDQKTICRKILQLLYHP
jgi:hypothetical protein